MDYFLCMPDISFSEEQCKALERIVKKLSEGNRLTYVGEAMEVAGKKMPAYLKKYRLNKMEEDFKIEDPEQEGYLTRKEEERILAVCETEEEAELMKSCIYGYAYFRPSLIELKSFRKPKILDRGAEGENKKNQVAEAEKKDTVPPKKEGEKKKRNYLRKPAVS